MVPESAMGEAYRRLIKWCRASDFAGYDPFDALNSNLLQATPLRSSRLVRLAWTQLNKRCPINLRGLMGVPRQQNAKGVALFALAALADYRRIGTIEAESDARLLLDSLLSLRLEAPHGAAWGYNFDWQGRAFFAPRGTPTVVPTCFAVRALVEAARVFGAAEYLPVARSACDFILQDLNRSVEAEDRVCFSYTPGDRTRVFNASLLAAEALATVGSLTQETNLIDWGLRAARYVLRQQRSDGSWTYGAAAYQSWVDNFHTAFVLTSLSRLIRSAFGVPPARDQEGFSKALRRGAEFWRERFFLTHGWPKYYLDRLYPADSHAAGAALATLSELSWLDEAELPLAERVASWTIENLRSPRGFFYYQRRRFYTVRIPYMRWSQAWMAYGLGSLLEVKEERSGPMPSQ
jgi:hypothetical protein